VKQVIKYFKHVLFILTMVVIQLAVIPFLGGWLSYFNIIIVALVFICVVYGPALGKSYAFALGIILDLFSPLPFGINLISILAVIFIAEFLLEKMFINRSFYALICLTGAALIILKTLSSCFSGINRFIATKDTAFITERMFADIDGFLMYLVFNLMLAAIIFFIFNIASRRFKAVFIDTARG